MADNFPKFSTFITIFSLFHNQVLCKLFTWQGTSWIINEKKIALSSVLKFCQFSKQIRIKFRSKTSRSRLRNHEKYMYFFYHGQVELLEHEKTLFYNNFYAWIHEKTEIVWIHLNQPLIQNLKLYVVENVMKHFICVMLNSQSKSSFFLTIQDITWYFSIFLSSCS